MYFIRSSTQTRNLFQRNETGTLHYCLYNLLFIGVQPMVHTNCQHYWHANNPALPTRYLLRERYYVCPIYIYCTVHYAYSKNDRMTSQTYLALSYHTQMPSSRNSHKTLVLSRGDVLTTRTPRPVWIIVKFAKSITTSPIDHQPHYLVVKPSTTSLRSRQQPSNNHVAPSSLIAQPQSHSPERGLYC